MSIDASNPSRPEMAAELVLTGQSVLVQVGGIFILLYTDVCAYVEHVEHQHQ